MNKKIRNMAVAGVAVVAVVGLLATRLLNREPFAEGVADPIVEITQPELRDIKISTGLVGEIEPEDVVYVYPKAAGEVTEVSVKAGEMVQQGQQLCVIDTKQIENAKSSLDSAELNLKQAKDELARQEILYAGGGISQQAYEQYQNNVQSAQIAYDNAKTNYDNQVSYSRIQAPISGVVEVCNADVFDQAPHGIYGEALCHFGTGRTGYDSSGRFCLL